MRSYVVNFPMKASELKDLEGKIVRFFDRESSQNFLGDSVIFKVDSASIEIINQISRNNSIVSNKISLFNLSFEYKGILYDKKKKVHSIYNIESEGYYLRRRSLNVSGLWIDC